MVIGVVGNLQRPIVFFDIAHLVAEVDANFELLPFVFANEMHHVARSIEEADAPVIQNIGLLAIEIDLFEIVEDGTVNSWEYDDFMRIKDMLEKIAISADALGLWLEQAIASGKVKAPD